MLIHYLEHTMSITLNETKAAFSQWRDKGLHSGRPSNALKAMAVSLLTEHPKSVVSEAIGISSKTLSNWKKNLEKDSVENNGCDEIEKLNFISFSPVINTDIQHDKSILTSGQLILNLPSNLQLIIEGKSPEESAQLIRYLIQGLSA